MGIIIFVLWLILNAHIGLDVQFLEIVLFGILLSVTVYFFMIKFTRWTFRFDLFFLRNLHLFIAYGAVLLWNVVISNFNVAAMILKPHESPEPCIVTINVPLKDEMLRSILANSITLTPGTITIASAEDHFTVHCLKKEYIDGIEDTLLVRLLVKMEANLK